MKKLLLTLSSVLVVGVSTSTLISCGIKPENEVVFMLFGTTSSNGDQEKRKNFQDIAESYNQAYKNEPDFVPVKVVMRSSNYLDLAIQSGDNLPDLYVSYVDAASTYVDSSIGNQVRDMKESMGEGFKKFEEDLITPAFMEEGQYKNTQIVLPFGKSFDISVINVNLFIQFMALFPELVTLSVNLSDNFNEYNKQRSDLLDGSEEWVKTKIFREGLSLSKTQSDNDSISIDQNVYDSLVEEMKKVKDVNLIKEFFNSTENVLNVASAFREIVDNDGLDVTVTLNEADKSKSVKPNETYNFAFGMDSIDNKYYMDYAATKGAKEGVINVEDSISPSPDKDFWYSTTYNNKIANIELNPYSQGFLNTTKYLQGMKDIALKNDKASSTEWRDQWNGVFSAARRTSTTQNWVTEDFVKSTMFMASASSANDIYFTDQFKDKDVQIINNGTEINGKATYRPVSKADVITTSTTNGENSNGKSVFLSQGRGIAGFKSNGNNAAAKEKSVTNFLNYMMQPIQTAQYGLKTSYMPATKSGMSIYESYLDGSYNNTSDEIKKVDKLSNVIMEIEKDYFNNPIDKQEAKALIPEYFQQIKDSTGNPEVKAGVSSVNTAFIKDYLDPLIKGERDDIELVSSKAIPTTDIIRSSLKPALTGTGGLLDLRASGGAREIGLDKLLEDGNQYYNLSRYIRTYQNQEFYRQINVKITENPNTTKK
ncbi:hypothetical protein CK556_00145 [Mesoplasma chauliocola]|uniref:Uncharacterized protein n=1 Tax=Mesoplasma chauliocola TaxID=216427 RepID=A0A249SMG0_9MOLU|nr:hypothetical protein [Mesoplasma chauliocola]ASZ08779.1 hypothetical protein CK556_00145 [Mesoplasma chauliocola]